MTDNRRPQIGRRQPISLRPDSLVKAGGLAPPHPLPLVLSPAVAGVELAAWMASQRDWVQAQLGEHGAVLFRGFGIQSPAAFEAAAQALCADLLTENGEHVRVPGTRHVQTPVAYSATQKLLWHNENTFNARWPLKLLLGCLQPATTGGETPLVDSRAVYARIPAAIRERFMRHGVMYVRNFGTNFGLQWQTVYGVRTRQELDALSRQHGIALTWLSETRLRAVAVRPAAIRHPITQQWTWINQALHWHTACLGKEVREVLQASYGSEDLPRTCHFGDGTPIPDDVMLELMNLYAELERCFPWEAGDFLVLDNALTAHARNAYTGERRVLVALGEMTEFSRLHGEHAAAAC